MDYRDERMRLDSLRSKFYDRQTEIELLDDCVSEALTKRAIPITVTLSAATYFGIREGFLKNNGLAGLLRKNFLCMCIGIGASMIGIQSDYRDKLDRFYTSHRYQAVRNMIVADWKDQRRINDAPKPFLQPNHLNLDLERPHFEGIDVNRMNKSKNDENHLHPHENVTYEELQRKNREKYAIKHNELVKY